MPWAVWMRLRAENKSGTNPTRAGSGLVPHITDADVEAFCEAHQDNDRPKALRNLANRIRRERTETYAQVRAKLRVAAQESRLGFYPYEAAIDEIRNAAIDSYEARAAEGDNRAFFDEHDFDRLVINGIEQASLKTDEQCPAEANRSYGTHHDDPRNTRTLKGWSLGREDDSTESSDNHTMDNVLKFPKGSAGEKPEGSDSAGLFDSIKDDVNQFWESSQELSNLRQFAQARLVGPWAMLGTTLARVIAHTRPTSCCRRLSAALPH